MTLTLTPELEAALTRHALKRGQSPEALALQILDEISALPSLPLIPRDEWERILLSGGYETGVVLTDEQLSRESIYED